MQGLPKEDGDGGENITVNTALENKKTKIQGEAATKSKPRR
jgi:hypothetical protein